jgi:hypothetical protein
MPQEPTFPVFDYGSLFAKQKRVYLLMVDVQERIHKLLDQVSLSYDAAMVKAAEVSKDPKIAPEDRWKVERLVADANSLMIKARAAVRNVDLMRLEMLRDVVDHIGSTIMKLRAWRNEIVLGEKGLETSFDPMLDGIEVRYREVYRPIFPMGKLPGSKGAIPDPSGWTEQEWEQIQDLLDGPLFLWSPKECEENWRVAGVPDCDGPDYFHTLSLINQVFVAKENQLDIQREFPIVATVDYMLLGGEMEEYDKETEAAKTALDATKNVLEDLMLLLGALVEGARKVAQTFAKAPILVLAAGVLALTLLKKR